MHGVQQGCRNITRLQQEDACMHNKSSCSLEVFLCIFRFAARSQPSEIKVYQPDSNRKSRRPDLLFIQVQAFSSSQTTPILLGLLRQHLTLLILLLLLVFGSEASRRRTQHHARTSVRRLIYSPPLLKRYPTQPCFPRYAVSLWWVPMKSRLTLRYCSPYQRYRFAAGSMLWHVWRQRRLHRRSAEIDLSQ